MSHFKLVYDVLTDTRNKLSQRDFTKAMSRLNVTTAVKRVKDKTARGVVLLWKLDNNTKQEIIDTHFEERDKQLLKGVS